MIQNPWDACCFGASRRSNHVGYDELDAVGLTDFVHALEGALFKVQALVNALLLWQPIFDNVS
jgi:hypothetical protein